MKFNMMINGIETLFPDAEVHYFKEDNKLVIYFLNLNKEVIKRIEKNIQNLKKVKLRIEENFLVLNVKDFQCAYDLNKTPNLIDLYTGGIKLGFAFEDEDGKLLDIETPLFSHEI